MEETSQSGNLIHLEEYVDTIISLPHEIQRNLTMIKEHDSKVQEENLDLFKDIDEFMKIQGQKSPAPIGEEKIKLIKRIKNAFLITLTHSEEKVSLSNQCYNSVEKHLIKLEDDLKCFEEEIRLSGYDELLEKVKIEKNRQRQQIQNKKRKETGDFENESENENLTIRLPASGAGNNSRSEKQRRSNRTAAGKTEKPRSSEKAVERVEKRQRFVNTTVTSENKKIKLEVSGDEDEEVDEQITQATEYDEDEDGEEDGEEIDNEKKNLTKVSVSRAERLLRRTRPNFILNEIGDVTSKNDINENQGDDEAEENSSISQDEEEDNETRDEIFDDYPKRLSENENESESEIENEIDEQDKDKMITLFESELSDNASINSQSYSQSQATLKSSKRNNLNRKSLTSSRNDSNSISSGIEEDFESTSKIHSLPQPSTTINSSGNEPVYCTCKQVSFGQMIACDGQECPVEWFHSTCVGLKSLPKGKWYCKGCQESLDSKTAAQMAIGVGGMSTRSSRNRS